MSSMTRRIAAITPRILWILLFAVGLLASVADAQVRVRGYTRKDGTYVKPHYRSRPDGNFDNNWSTAGNVNPYTGKIGTKTQPSTRAPGYSQSRQATGTYWLGNVGSSAPGRTPLRLPTRSSLGTTAVPSEGLRSGSRVMMNPFVGEGVVEGASANVDPRLVALKEIFSKVDVLARDSSLPHWYRAVCALQVLSELEFEDLPKGIQARMQPRYDAINSILAEYSFTNGSDFKRLSDRDAKRILTHLREIASIDLRVN